MNEGLSEVAGLSVSEFREIARLVEQKFGIHLTDQKKALVRGRLSKSLRSRGLTSYTQYLDLISRDRSGEILGELIDRISTNHTYFFREPDHFQFLHDVALPEMSHENDEIRLWCAGCATGEEAYTLAMVASEWQQRQSVSVKILATDISVTALETALAGIYSEERVNSLPPAWLKRYFEPQGPDRWSVVQAIRSMVLFKRLNFMDDQFPFRRTFHGIFCRNVMIYFDKATKEALVRRLAASLSPGRYLFIGHSESLGRETEDFVYVRPSVYRRRQ